MSIQEMALANKGKNYRFEVHEWSKWTASWCKITSFPFDYQALDYLNHISGAEPECYCCFDAVKIKYVFSAALQSFYKRRFIEDDICYTLEIPIKCDYWLPIACARTYKDGFPF
jgi:hypothetical protein